MSIYNIVNETLLPVIPCTYFGFPDLSGEKPATYATYITREEPLFYADDGYQSTEHRVIVNVFTPETDITLYNSVKAAFIERGFIYKSGMDAVSMNEVGYPMVTYYVMEFIITTEEEII